MVKHQFLLVRSCCVFEGVVHLSGYVLPEDEFPGPCDDMDDSDEDKEDEDDDDDEDVPQLCITHYCCLYFELTAN